MKFISSHLKEQHIVHINDVQQIDKDDVFYRYDVFHISQITEIFNSKGLPGLFLSDMMHYENFYPEIEFLGLPVFLERTRQSWKYEEFANEIPETLYCFNFMINKKQINRYLCIKLVELLELKHFKYTWSGVDNCFDCSVIIEEQKQLGSASPLTADQFSKLLSPIETVPVFFQDAPLQNVSNSSIDNYGGNRQAWDWGIDKMFAQSAVSLITESVAYQKASTFTEKTLFCLLGLNFPIWIGGHKQAEIWESFGFDIFNDVINHDYQYCDTLLERCSYAFLLNEQILTDVTYAKSVRKRCLDRLYHNRQLILSGKLTNVIAEKITSHLYYESNLKQCFDEYLNYWKIDIKAIATLT